MKLRFVDVLFFIMMLLIFPQKLREGDQRAVREIASVDNCISIVGRFFPGQSINFLEERLLLVTDFHSFYRTFVPLFYDEILKLGHFSSFESLHRFKGFIGGDVHIENFGFVKWRDKFHLVINDVDDSTIGEFFLDPIRHYNSGKIVKADRLNWDDYFKAYETGIRGEEREFSKFTREALKNGQNRFSEVWNKFIGTINSKPKFIKKKGKVVSIPIEEEERLKSLFMSEFDLGEVHDFYLRIKSDGGSAGLKRYQLLATNRKGHLNWYDIKETDVSAYDKVLNHGQSILGIKEKYKEVEQKFYDGADYDVVLVGKKYYSVRKINQFALGVTIADVPKKDLTQLVYDEAYVLGFAHRVSLKEQELVNEYLEEFRDISADDIEILSRDLLEQLNRIYESR